jgi:hypothetical protein
MPVREPERRTPKAVTGRQARSEIPQIFAKNRSELKIPNCPLGASRLSPERTEAGAASRHAPVPARAFPGADGSGIPKPDLPPPAGQANRPPPRDSREETRSAEPFGGFRSRGP